MWLQGAYGQQQYPQQYQYIPPSQGPYGNIPPMNNNNNINQIPSEVIDWNGVSSIDPDLIKMTGDLTQLRPFISKFVAANLSDYNSQILTHPLSVRLCSILQVSLQYMSDTQKELQAEIEKRDQYIAKQQSDFKKLSLSYAKADELLRKQMKPSERCPLCLRRFKNFDFLDQHVERKHPEHADEWFSIRNKRPIQKQNQNDINAIMERIEALQKSLRKDREKQKHHGRRRKDDNDENIQTLRQELHDQQDQLMATEAIQDELLMTKREDMKSELNSAVDDLNASWIAWSNNAKKVNKNDQKNKEKKFTNEEDELNNMYKNDHQMINQFDRLEDQFEIDGNFCNCQSIDDNTLKDQNFDENQMNHFQFQMLQNNESPIQQQQQPQQQQEKETKKKHEKTKSKKSKNSKHSIFGRKKSKNDFNSEDPNSKDHPIDSNINEIDQPHIFEDNTPKVQKSKSKSKFITKKSNPKLPPRKKDLPDDVKGLIAKARTIIIRKFIPNYDESTVNHVMRSIEKKMNHFRQQYANNNESPEQVTDSLRSNFDGEQNDYNAIRRRVLLQIDNEAPVKHCNLFESSFSESSALSANETKQVHINRNPQPQQQQKPQDISQSSISITNKKLNSNNLDGIPKPNNSQFSTSYTNYVSNSISTTLSIQKTPQEGTATRKRKRKATKPSKSTFSLITSNSNIHEIGDQNQDISKSNENPNPPPSNTKKLQFTKPRQHIQCKKHFKSAGHSVQSPFPNLSATPGSTMKKANRNNPNKNEVTPNNNNNYGYKNNINNNSDINNNNNNYAYNSNNLNYNPNGGINYNDYNNDFGINQQFANYQNNMNNEQIKAPNDAIFFMNPNQEVEYVYDEEEEEEEEIADQNVPIDNVANQNSVFEEEEEENESTNFVEQIEIQAADPVEDEEQQLIATEVPKDNDDEYESFNLSKSFNQPVIEPPKYVKYAKNEITSSTDPIFDVPPSPPHFQQQYPQEKDPNDSLDQSDISNGSTTKPAQNQPIQKVPQIVNNNNNSKTVQYEYEYEYYTDETVSKSEAELPSASQQNVALNPIEKVEKPIEQEEENLNSQIQQEQQQQTELEPFTMYSQSQPITTTTATTTVQSNNSLVDNKSEVIENPNSNQNQVQSQNQTANMSYYTKSEYYSSSGTNFLFKFDSSTTLAKSKSKENSNQNAISNSNESTKNSSDEKPVKQQVYKCEKSKVGSMDNIVSFDEVKSIESIENIQNTQKSGIASVTSAGNSKFNFDSLIQQSNGGDSFMSESMGKSISMDQDNFDQPKLSGNEQQEESPQSIDPSSYNISPATTSSGNTQQTQNDSFISKQRNILAAKYGNPPPQQQKIQPQQQQAQVQQQQQQAQVQQQQQQAQVQQQQQQAQVQQQQQQAQVQPPQQQAQVQQQQKVQPQQQQTQVQQIIRQQQPTQVQQQQKVQPQQQQAQVQKLQQKVQQVQPQRQQVQLQRMQIQQQAIRTVINRPQINNDDEYELEEEEEEDEYEEYEFEDENNNKNAMANNNKNVKLPNSFVGSETGAGSAASSSIAGAKKFNVIDLFKQSSNSSFVKLQKTNSKSFLGSKVQKTFAGSSSAGGGDDDDFDYSRGPPTNNNIGETFNDDDFESESNFNNNHNNDNAANQPIEKESGFKSTEGFSNFVDDSDGPPMLSRRKNNDSVISNDDFNL